MEAAGLPATVLLVKAVGWMQGLTFALLSNRRAHLLRSSDATASTTGSPDVLLAYRLAMLGWALFIGLRQLADKGPYVFVFFTVWNWWLLALFFLAGSAASLRDWLRRRRHAKLSPSGGSSGLQQQGQQGQQPLEEVPADWLDRTVMAIFAVEMPASVALDALTWLVLVPMLEREPSRREFWHSAHHNFESYNMTLAIDFLTWTVLVPMIFNDPNSTRIQFWESRIYCFESYNQHGFNAVMMLGDLALNRIPVSLLDSGWIALWSSAFGVWSGLFYSRTGRFIYPFLDVQKPYAWVSYVGIFAVLWIAFLLLLGLIRAKAWLLPATAAAPRKGSLQGPAREPAPPGSAGSCGGGMRTRSSVRAGAGLTVQECLVDAHIPLLSGDKLKVG